jgi:hypothetical protein
MGLSVANPDLARREPIECSKAGRVQQHGNRHGGAGCGAARPDWVQLGWMTLCWIGQELLPTPSPLTAQGNRQRKSPQGPGWVKAAIANPTH